eukprot:4782153-Prymnesium_polylepis.3
MLPRQSAVRYGFMCVYAVVPARCLRAVNTVESSRVCDAVSVERLAANDLARSTEKLLQIRGSCDADGTKITQMSNKSQKSNTNYWYQHDIRGGTRAVDICPNKPPALPKSLPGVSARHSDSLKIHTPSEQRGHANTQPSWRLGLPWEWPVPYASATASLSTTKETRISLSHAHAHTHGNQHIQVRDGG